MPAELLGDQFSDSSSRLHSTSLAPSAASARALARPSPLLAPVTTYTRSLRPKSMAVILRTRAY